MSGRGYVRSPFSNNYCVVAVLAVKAVPTTPAATSVKSPVIPSSPGSVSSAQLFLDRSSLCFCNNIKSLSLRSISRRSSIFMAVTGLCLRLFANKADSVR